MITWIIRIFGWIMVVLTLMGGHWGWSIFWLLIALGFYVKKDGKIV